MIELRHIIEQKQELLTRESISRPALDYSEGMTAEEQKCYINYLAERVREADLGLRTRDVVLQDFLDKQQEYDERLSRLDEVLSCVEDLKKELVSEVKKCKSAERKVSDLTAKLKFTDKNRFGDKRQSVKKKKTGKGEEADRGKDDEDFDDTVDSLSDNSVSKNQTSSKEENPPKEGRDLSNCPEAYRTMGGMDQLKCISPMMRRCLDGSLAGRWSRFFIWR